MVSLGYLECVLRVPNLRGCKGVLNGSKDLKVHQGVKDKCRDTMLDNCKMAQIRFWTTTQNCNCRYPRGISVFQIKIGTPPPLSPIYFNK